MKGAIVGVLHTSHQASPTGPTRTLHNTNKGFLPAPVDKEESLIDDDGDIQIVSFNHEKPPQFTALENGPACILPIPIQNNKLLDVISEEEDSVEAELPPYSLVESFNTNTKKINLNTAEGNYFSRYHYETFNDKTFNRTELDFSKFRKTMREVLPVKDTKTSMKRKRFTQNKLFQGVLQGHS